MEPEEVAEAFVRLHAAGKVRGFGVSNQNARQMELLQKFVPFKLQVNQLQFGPAHTALVDAGLHVNIDSAAGIPHDDGILDYCRLHGVTIQAWSRWLWGASREL